MAVGGTFKLRDADAEGADYCERREGVRSAWESCDGGLTFGGGVQDERAVADGLVAGRLDIEFETRRGGDASVSMARVVLRFG